MTSEFDDNEIRHTGLYIGVVVKRDDDEKLGRVKFRIPGLIEPISEWAFPLGTVGGGSDARGFYAVPEEGAEVGVLFHQGDVDHPYYLCGHWGKPGGNSEAPTPIRNLSKSDAPQVRVFETARYLISFDDRKDNELLTIKDKSSGAKIEIKGSSKEVHIEADAVTIHANKDARLEGQNTLIHADRETKIDGQSVTIVGGGAAAARKGDDVAPNADMAAWITAVTAAVNALGAGAKPPTGSMGTIFSGSAKVTIG